MLKRLENEKDEKRKFWKISFHTEAATGGALKNFANLTGKQLCFNKVAEYSKGFNEKLF